jgi:hypothetical protein
MSAQKQNIRNSISQEETPALELRLFYIRISEQLSYWSSSSSSYQVQTVQKLYKGV